MCDRSSSSSTGGAAPDSRLYCEMDIGTVLVEHRIRPNTVVAVLGCNVQCECLNVLLSVSTIVLKTPGYGKAQVF